MAHDNKPPARQPDPESLAPPKKPRRTREERIAELQALQARDMLREELKIAMEQLASTIREAKAGTVPWLSAVHQCESVMEALRKIEALP
jgi:hypothetical protein